MRIRKLAILSAILVLVGLTAMTAVADPLGWFDKAPFEYSGNDFHDRIEFQALVWPDGSAEVLVKPKRQLPPEQLPAAGLITVNTKEYKFAKRDDRDGNPTLYASLPVEAIPMEGQVIVSMTVTDETGHKLIYKYAELTLNE
ncbi:MAG: hypothetical protein H6819_10970 [Phycisphaerales bacterium]|nr:hypothetical protein [Phycisphaerales bacterium]MCB9855593.1 hypothetical protein [Phycisphaerales bacterium]MCB9864918.1 hypothetical protein [Phycisphaerales bacterium]